MGYILKNDLSKYIRTAKQLGYSKEVIKALRNAKNDTQRTNIMIAARRGTFEPKEMV